jgi:SAM-dependent methyltransferase
LPKPHTIEIKANGQHALKFLAKGNGSQRRVKCGKCGTWADRSILPHVRLKHPELWKDWTDDFVRLWNQGYSSRRIMTQYGRLFTWAIIEKELRKIGTNDPKRLQVSKREIKEWRPSKRTFRLEKNTVWQFRRRGDWCLHSSEYRGNWAPQIPRNLVIRFSKRGWRVLDPFVGGGTTAIECILEGRDFVGVDINPLAIQMTKAKIRIIRTLSRKSPDIFLPSCEAMIIEGDARNLNFIEDQSIDLICAHPPYADSLQYTDGVKADISQIHKIDEYCDAMKAVAEECYRVLKKNRICAVLIGDIRRRRTGEFVPLESLVCKKFLDAGFVLRDRIVKLQYKDKSTAFYLDLSKQNRFLIAHEYLLIFKRTS